MASGNASSMAVTRCARFHEPQERQRPCHERHARSQQDAEPAGDRRHERERGEHETLQRDPVRRLVETGLLHHAPQRQHAGQRFEPPTERREPLEIPLPQQRRRLAARRGGQFVDAPPQPALHASAGPERATHDALHQQEHGHEHQPDEQHHRIHHDALSSLGV